MEKFFARFNFKPALRGAIGVEREFFLTDCQGQIAPRAVEFLSHMEHPSWTHELSACIVEHRTEPTLNASYLHQQLVESVVSAQKVASDLNLCLKVLAIAPEDMPLDVYPTERYQQIAVRLKREELLAACRLAGVHIHLGVSDLNEAIQVYNRLSQSLAHFIQIGDKSQGQRLRLYSVVAPKWQPKYFASPAEFYKDAVSNNYLENPRNCWSLVRISIHGTVEVRAFGMVADPQQIVDWAQSVTKIAFP